MADSFGPSLRPTTPTSAINSGKEKDLQPPLDFNLSDDSPLSNKNAFPIDHEGFEPAGRWVCPSLAVLKTLNSSINRIEPKNDNDVSVKTVSVDTFKLDFLTLDDDDTEEAIIATSEAERDIENELCDLGLSVDPVDENDRYAAMAEGLVFDTIETVEMEKLLPSIDFDGLEDSWNEAIHGSVANIDMICVTPWSRWNGSEWDEKEWSPWQNVRDAYRFFNRKDMRKMKTAWIEKEGPSELTLFPKKLTEKLFPRTKIARRKPEALEVARRAQLRMKYTGEALTA